MSGTEKARANTKNSRGEISADPMTMCGHTRSPECQESAIPFIFPCGNGVVLANLDRKSFCVGWSSYNSIKFQSFERDSDADRDEVDDVKPETYRGETFSTTV
jgi:hypothetical protein